MNKMGELSRTPVDLVGARRHRPDPQMIFIFQDIEHMVIGKKLGEVLCL